MKSRERLTLALRHEEPDRVPIDFGALRVSSIDALAYCRLRKSLGLPDRPIRVAPQTFINTIEYGSNIAEVEKEILDLFHVDVINVNRVLDPRGPLTETSNEWKEWNVNGNLLEIHASVNITEDEDGWILTLPDSSLVPGGKKYKMLRKDFTCIELWRKESSLKDAKSVEDIKEFDWDLFKLRDDVLDGIKKRAEYLYANTDYGLVLFDVGSLHANIGQVLRGWTQWLIDLKIRRTLAEAILDRAMEVLKYNLKKYVDAIKDYIQVIGFADDLGTQEGPQIPPQLFRDVYKHRYEELFGYIKKHSKMFILLHSDGAISPFLKDLIDVGLDAINPVQFTCKDMDPEELKKNFGDQVTFWGGGVDTQGVLPYAKPEEIAKHVEKLVSIFSPGGGYVYATVHIVPGNTPPGNVISAFKTAYECGKYH
ncbi:MAG: uroporphyrinogen decarboxylase family protein [Thermoproteota archaeon]